MQISFLQYNSTNVIRTINCIFGIQFLIGQATLENIRKYDRLLWNCATFQKIQRFLKTENQAVTVIDKTTVIVLHFRISTGTAIASRLVVAIIIKIQQCHQTRNRIFNGCGILKWIFNL
jgi:hypothetical protein